MLFQKAFQVARHITGLMEKNYPQAKLRNFKRKSLKHTICHRESTIYIDTNIINCDKIFFTENLQYILIQTLLTMTKYLSLKTI